jgi:catechol 2,3-dioxygenase-like lactoylglutathione lyase family enzyme
MLALQGVKGKILAMKCLRLTHVNVRVEHLEDAVRFYTQVMGLEPIERQDRKGKGAWFRLGGTEVHLAEDPTPQPRSKRHFAVEVADLAEARKTADRYGAEIDQEEAGRFWMRDPSGNRIEVVQSR